MIAIFLQSSYKLSYEQRFFDGNQMVKKQW